MSDEQIVVHTGFMIAFTVIMAGFGLEGFFLVLLLNQWSQRHEIFWRLAQFLFPLLTATAFGLAFHQHFSALIFITVGLFKFGFPETLSYTYLALYDTSRPVLIRILNLMDSVGLVGHHSSFILFLSMLLVGVIPLSRYVVLASFFLIAQHWFVLLKYTNVGVYLLLELILEFWFEWTVISQFQYHRSIHWVASWVSASMLVAHWLFFLAASCRVLTAADAMEDNLNENVFISVLRIQHIEQAAKQEEIVERQETEQMLDLSLCEC